MNLVFYISGAVAVLATLMVITRANAVHALLYLVVSLLSVAMVFVSLGAAFAAALEVIVYAGAIMVLFLYVMMLLNLNEDIEPHKPLILKLAAVICAGLLMIILIGSQKGADQIESVKVLSEIGTVKNLGRIMFSEFLLPFEITSVLLLAAMVGAVMWEKIDETMFG